MFENQIHFVTKLNCRSNDSSVCICDIGYCSNNNNVLQYLQRDSKSNAFRENGIQCIIIFNVRQTSNQNCLNIFESQ